MGRLIASIKKALDPQVRVEKAKAKSLLEIEEINAETKRIKAKIAAQKPLINAKTARVKAEADLLKARAQLAKQQARAARYKGQGSQGSGASGFLKGMEEAMEFNPGGGGGAMFQDPFAPLDKRKRKR